VLQIITRDLLQPLKPVQISLMEELVDMLAALAPLNGFEIYIAVTFWPRRWEENGPFPACNLQDSTFFFCAMPYSISDSGGGREKGVDV